MVNRSEASQTSLFWFWTCLHATSSTTGHLRKEVRTGGNRGRNNPDTCRIPRTPANRLEPPMVHLNEIVECGTIQLLSMTHKPFPAWHEAGCLKV